MESQTFLYFAYGSNLLAQRIHIQNPSAVRVAFGKIQDYQLDFVTFSKRWKGASATIIKREGRSVWGAIWELDTKHIDSLDHQEGVSDNIYFPHVVDVILPDNSIRKCRVYEQCNSPSATEIIEDIPDERKPSAVYHSVIVKGAAESNLPVEYQNFLKRIPHNGYSGYVDIGLDLNIV